MIKQLTFGALLAPMAGNVATTINTNNNFASDQSTYKIQDGLKFIKISSDWKNEVIYQIFPIAYRDSNGDNMGDLKGIQDSIPYLKKLGVTSIWLNPILKSGSYHKYDTSDYYSIDPTFGTMDDFKNMVKAMHDNNIKLIMDFAFNHSSTTNKWFKAAIDPSDPNHSKYEHFYKIEPGRSNLKPETHNYDKWRDIFKVTQKFSKDYDQSKKYRSGIFYSAFSNDDMADLNLANPDVKKEIIDVAKFWMQKGVDGFRLDATRHAFDDAEYSYNSSFIASKLNQDFWTDFSQEIIEYGHTLNKQIYIVGENAFYDSKQLKQYTSSFSQLNFPFYYKLRERLSGKIQRDIAKEYKNDLNYYKKIDIENFDYWGTVSHSGNARLKEGNPNYIDTTFISNHDNSRIRSLASDSAAMAKFSAALQMMLTGIPIIYYGDELGLSATKNSSNDFSQRQPMPWDKKGSYKANYIPHFTSSRPTLTYNDITLNAEDEQSNKFLSQSTKSMADETANNTFALYQKLISFRKNAQFITHPEKIYDFNTPFSNEAISAIKYVYKNRDYIVLANFSHYKKTINISDSLKNQKFNFTTTSKIGGVEKKVFKLSKTSSQKNSMSIYNILGDYEKEKNNEVSLNGHSIIVVETKAVHS